MYASFLQQAARLYTARGREGGREGERESERERERERGRRLRAQTRISSCLPIRSRYLREWPNPCTDTARMLEFQVPLGSVLALEVPRYKPSGLRGSTEEKQCSVLRLKSRACLIPSSLCT